MSPAAHPGAAAPRGPRRALHSRILFGLLVGAAAGVAANTLCRDAPWLAWSVDTVARPVGQVFLRLLFMVVVPLVSTSLVLGVSPSGRARSSPSSSRPRSRRRSASRS